MKDYKNTKNKLCISAYPKMKTNNAIYFQCNIDWLLGDLRVGGVIRTSEVPFC